MKKMTPSKIANCIFALLFAAVSIVNLILIGYLVYIFFFGYTSYGLFSNEGTTYYGLRAWKNNWGAIIFPPFIIINFVYIVFYLRLTLKKCGRKNRIVQSKND